MIGWVASRILAAVGVALAMSMRRWAIVVGLAAATIGVAGLLLFLAARGTFVSTRYVIPIDLAILFAAGLGFGALRVPALSRLRVLGDRWICGDTATDGAPGSAGAIAIGIGTAAALWVPLGDASGPTRRRGTRALRDQAVRADRAVPVIRQALANVPGGVGEPDRSKVLAAGVPDQQILVVPSPLRPRLAVDTGVGLTKTRPRGADLRDSGVPRARAGARDRPRPAGRRRGRGGLRGPGVRTRSSTGFASSRSWSTPTSGSGSTRCPSGLGAITTSTRPR